MDNNEIIITDDVRVRVMPLAVGATTEWHHHTRVTDFIVCLTGEVRVEAREPEETMLLMPRQRCSLLPGRVHRVVNRAAGTSEYLLVQGVGPYDFCKEQS